MQGAEVSSKLVGIQAESLGGSFHEEAASIAYAGQDVSYVPYQQHGNLLRGLFAGEVDEIVTAVDNNTSGRVVTGIDALRNHSGVQVRGSITIPIQQRLLLYPGMELEDLDAVMSQRPALSQCERHIANAGLKTIESHDTLFSASQVRKLKGVYDGMSFAALASRLAGETNELTIGPAFQDNPHNATKFWIVTRGHIDVPGTHTALTFEVRDRPGELRRAVGVLSVDYGLNLTDIDSHLAPHREQTRAFFAEVEHGEAAQITPVLVQLASEGFAPKVLGHYTPMNTLEVEDGQQIPPALKHDMWEGRKGLDVSPDAVTMYIETDHRPGALYNMLGCLTNCNLVDLGRPIVPKDHHFNRGFYVILDPDTHPAQLQATLDKLRTHDYKVDVLETA